MIRFGYSVHIGATPPLSFVVALGKAVGAVLRARWRRTSTEEGAREAVDTAREEPTACTARLTRSVSTHATSMVLLTARRVCACCSTAAQLSVTALRAAVYIQKLRTLSLSISLMPYGIESKEARNGCKIVWTAYVDGLATTTRKKYIASLRGVQQ